jgi:gas vesicle protein
MVIKLAAKQASTGHKCERDSEINDMKDDIKELRQEQRAQCEVIQVIKESIIEMKADIRNMAERFLEMGKYFMSGQFSDEESKYWQKQNEAAMEKAVEKLQEMQLRFLETVVKQLSSKPEPTKPGFNLTASLVRIIEMTLVVIVVLITGQAAGILNFLK